MRETSTQTALQLSSNTIVFFFFLKIEDVFFFFCYFLLFLLPCSFVLFSILWKIRRNYIGDEKIVSRVYTMRFYLPVLLQITY